MPIFPGTPTPLLEDRRVIWRLPGQFPDRFPQDRVNGPGGDFNQRYEDKISFSEARMGNGQHGRIDDRVPGEEDIDVDCPRPLFEGRDTLHLGFN